MKQVGKSIRARLYNIAANQGISYQHLLIRFFHERLLYRISVSRYRDNFYLKGGALLYAFNTDEKQRYTLDIDFSLHQMLYDMEIVAQAVKEICEITADDAVQFHSQSMKSVFIRENNIYSGIRITVEASLDAIKQRLQIDLGYGDPASANFNPINYPVLLEDFVQPSVLVYSVEFVIAEKFHAMIELAELNSRMKDFYDVYQLLTLGKFNVDVLTKAVITTFHYRKTPYAASHALFTYEFVSDINRNRLWKVFLKKIGQPEMVPFSQVMQTIASILEPIWKSLKSRDK
jgi:predicted nucleotidyltransferase component of viral defense system